MTDMADEAVITLEEAAKSNSFLHKSTQVLLPTFTVLGFAFTSLKLPQWGLIFNLVSEVFWLYASWQAWKQAKQIGIFITTIFITAIVLFGVINYWIL